MRHDPPLPPLFWLLIVFLHVSPRNSLYSLTMTRNINITYLALLVIEYYNTMLVMLCSPRLPECPLKGTRANVQARRVLPYATLVATVPNVGDGLGEGAAPPFAYETFPNRALCRASFQCCSSRLCLVRLDEAKHDRFSTSRKKKGEGPPTSRRIGDRRTGRCRCRRI